MMVMVMILMGRHDERASPGHYEHFGVVAASLGAELDWGRGVAATAPYNTVAATIAASVSSLSLPGTYFCEEKYF
jgi:hypothetical protein